MPSVQLEARRLRLKLAETTGGRAPGSGHIESPRADMCGFRYVHATEVPTTDVVEAEPGSRPLDRESFASCCPWPPR